VLVRRLPSNCGPSVARNRALELSSAPWVAILDGDDFFLPGRMQRLVGAVDEFDFIADDILQIVDPEVGLDGDDFFLQGRMQRLIGAVEEFDFVADDILQIVDADVGNAERKPVFGQTVSEPSQLDFKTFVLGNVSRRGERRRELGFLKPLMRRSFLDRHHLRYEEALRLGEDYALYAHALALGARFLTTPACGYVSVVRSNSLSGNHSKEDLKQLRDFDLELGALANLSYADRRALKAHYRSVDARFQWLAVLDAFKSRNPRLLIAPFGRSSAVSIFLVRQLYGEALRRFRVKPMGGSQASPRHPRCRSHHHSVSE
jgi:succinoglycan biosynthesis protein ExoU